MADFEEQAKKLWEDCLEDGTPDAAIAIQKALDAAYKAGMMRAVSVIKENGAYWNEYDVAESYADAVDFEANQ